MNPAINRIAQFVSGADDQACTRHKILEQFTLSCHVQNLWIFCFNGFSEVNVKLFSMRLWRTQAIVCKIIKARSARLGKPGMDKILVKLIETPMQRFDYSSPFIWNPKSVPMQ
jgi:hypothetical protein